MLAPVTAFVDLETTGTAASDDRITEVGIVRVEGDRLVDEWSSLIHPGCPIPPEIQSMTGITDAMVAAAPRFGDIAAEVRGRLEGALFVAHNARFDYGFLKQEFRRAGQAFSTRPLCTARLSRRLFPDERRHNLDSLIERHRLPPEQRHRALGDARLLWHFVRAIQALLSEEAIRDAVDRVLKIPSLPPQLAADALDGIPEAPGVYLFYGLNALPIYIGKSINLRERVGSHFTCDYRSANDLRISAEIQRIEHRRTAGELGALLLESRLIKELLPLHNHARRRRLDLCALHLDLLPSRPRVVRADAVDDDAVGQLYGPFSSRRGARERLKALADQYGLCWKVLGLERGAGPCFAHQLRRCAGACVGAEQPAAHHARLLEALSPCRLQRWPVNGAAAVAERCAESGGLALHVFNRWRWLGTASSGVELSALSRVAPPHEFDFDAYRILAAHLARHPDAELLPVA